MKSKLRQLATAAMVSAAFNPAPAAVRYVDVNSASPTAPYTNWATAATNIQDAVDAAVPGDQILVTNGVYQTGGRAIYGSMTNRVAVDKPVALQSVNGPQFTLIQGWQVPGTTNGDGAIRCAYLTNGATLAGFTLTNGATRTSGDNPREVFGGGVWCESTNAVVLRCTLTGNSGYLSGGAYGGTLNNCTLTGNSTDSGGGGATSATLNNCALTDNSAYYGGGASDSTLNNCTVTGNSAGSGGGVNQCTLNNCIVYYNTAPRSPNYQGSVHPNFSCTTPPDGFGIGNISAEPELASASHLSAVSPCRGAGSASYANGTDIDREAWASPPSIGCDEPHAESATGALSVAMKMTPATVVTGFPAAFPAFYPVAFTGLIEGQTLSSAWDFGDGVVLSNRPYASHVWTAPGDYSVVLRAYNESSPGGVSATVTVHVVEQLVNYVAAASVTPLAPYSSWATAATNIQDAVDAALPGSLVLVTNGVYRTGGKAANFINSRVAIDKPLMVHSVNGAQFTIIEGAFGTRCILLQNEAFLAGFKLTNGNVGSSSVSGGGGGVFFGDAPSDAVVSNCVIISCTAVVGGGAASASTSGSPPGSTGGTFVDCTFANNGATGLPGGSDPLAYGGAVYRCKLVNCTLTNNTITLDSPYGGYGGGAYQSLLLNCLLVGNSCSIPWAAGSGGGAALSSLVNCTVVQNTGGMGGGVYACSVTNSVVYDNSGDDHASDNFVAYSCTTPMPTNGIGNITNAPLFADPANGNFRLQSNSPCINAANNGHVTSPVDLDGKERIVGGTVDMGVYEFQSPSSVLSYAWAQQYGLSTDGSADYADADNDRMNNWQEWIAGTVPTDATSALRLLSPIPSPSGAVVTWESVSNRTYFLQRTTNIGGTPFSLVASNILGQAGTTSFTDTNATGAGPFFYRVGVQ